MATEQPQQFTVFAIAGFAGAGKDTMADRLAEHLPEGARYTKLKMADALKGALNLAFRELGVDADCYTENRKEKEKLRPLMKEFGRYCRSRDKGVFATKVTEALAPLSLVADVVFVSDMRYINEHAVLSDLCRRGGWRYRAIYVETVGVKAANDEEEDSIAELLTMTDPGEIDYVTFDHGDIGAFDMYADEVVHSLYK